MSETRATTRSAALYEQSLQHIPGGVNSPVRAFGSVGGTPRFMHHSQGAWLYDEDDNAYVDYVGSWGPMILGHRHPDVIRALQEPRPPKRRSPTCCANAYPPWKV